MHASRLDPTITFHDRVQWSLTALLLAGAIVLGGAQGGQGIAGSLICQLLAVLLLAWLVLRWQWWGSMPALPGRWGWMLLVPLLLPLLQLLPMPMALWQQVVPRQALSAGMTAAGAGLQAQWSLVPFATEQALWAMLPALALAASVLWMPVKRQRQMLLLLLGLAVLSLLWGIVQRAQGPFSAMRLYSFTNQTDATGFFANRNHLASLLLMALPFAMVAAAWLTTQRLAGQPVSPLRVLSTMALAVFLVLGIALTRSRAGIVLCLLAIALSLPAVLTLRRQRGQRRVFIGVGLVGLLVTLQFGLTGILQRLHRSPMQDSRWGLFKGTVDAANSHAPLGSGLGTFRDVYPVFDASPGSMIVNHAHNDWLELWLEGGWPFALLAAAFLVFFAWAGWRAWRAKAEDVLLLQTRAAWIGLLLVMLHALVDYALRTTADMVVFGLLMALLVSGLARLQATEAEDAASSRRRHRSPPS